MTTSLKTDILDLYLDDIRGFSVPSRSQEFWLCVMKDASATLKDNFISCDLNDELEYGYIKLFNEFLIDLDDLGEKFALSKEIDLHIIVNNAIEESLILRDNIRPRINASFYSVIKYVPVTLQKDIYLLFQYVWLLPKEVKDLFIVSEDSNYSFPTLSSILDVFKPRVILREYEFVVDRGRQARDLLIISFLPYVKWFAHKYQGRGLELSDLIQEGNIGLLKAIRRFDPLELNRFKTYAYHWIRQSITRAISDKSRIMRIPVHKFDDMEKVRKKYIRYKHSNNHEPTIKYLASESDLSIADVLDCIKLSRPPLSLEVLEECEFRLVHRYGNPFNLRIPSCVNCIERNQPNLYNGDLIYLDQDIPLCLNPDFISEKRHSEVVPGILEKLFCTYDPNIDIEKMNEIIYIEKINNILSEINSRDSLVIKLRFGLNDGEELTLEQVGDILDVTRERVRQIESRVLKLIKGRFSSEFI